MVNVGFELGEVENASMATFGIRETGGNRNMERNGKMIRRELVIKAKCLCWKVLIREVKKSLSWTRYMNFSVCEKMWEEGE